MVEEGDEELSRICWVFVCLLVFNLLGFDCFLAQSNLQANVAHLGVTLDPTSPFVPELSFVLL